MKAIPLTRGFVALVDDEDHAWLSQYKWRVFRSGNYVYAARGVDCILMHRQIMGMPSEFVDHKDGIGINNQRNNLRIATRSQNMANRKLTKTSSSGFKGVFTCKKKWRARIKQDGKFVHLGIFENKEDAAKAYDEAARKLHGQFALLNFPKDGERGARDT